MSWGRALLSAALPALVVGPVSGLIGGLVVLITIAIADGSSEAVGYAAMIVLVSGLIVGLLVAGPMCAVLGGMLLKLAQGNEDWTKASRWALTGGVGGLAFGIVFIGALFADEIGYAGAWVGLSLFFLTSGLLGTIAAYLMWRMLRRRMASLNKVDPTVFE
uniref:hypothetical protein n=1 Tax=Parerythrobacter lutipelagi TaxID=1964208 RepID=UPI0010F9945A|nr:hypothetical protein [Parerythrobacter lutipelagi]